jgi:hypothetical protein
VSVVINVEGHPTHIRHTRCYKCGTAFAMEAVLYNQRLDDGQSFWCPNGHEQGFTKSRAARIEQLKSELEREKQTLRMTRSTLETTERRRSAAQGVATKRLKKLQRVREGNCPHCDAHFDNVAEHMAEAHGETEAAT